MPVKAAPVLRVFVGIVHLTLLFLAVVANAMLLFCFYKERGFSINDRILINLGASNIISAISRNIIMCVSVFNLIEIGTAWCRISFFFIVITKYLVMCCNCFLSLNQSLQLLKHKYLWVMRLALRLEKYLPWIFRTSWVLSTILAIAHTASSNMRGNTTSTDEVLFLNVCVLHASRLKMVVEAVCGTLIPKTIILISSLILVRKLWQHSKQIHSSCPSRSAWTKNRQKTATKTVLLLVTFFALCWVIDLAVAPLRSHFHIWEPKVITSTVYATVSALIIILGSSRMKRKLKSLGKSVR